MDPLTAAAMFTLPTCLAFRGGQCPPTGPVLPPPFVPASFNPLQLSQHLDGLVQDGDGPWNTSTTSISIELTSPSNSFFTYHHTATTRDPRGVETVDSDSVYRVASLTKVFDALLLLMVAPEELDTPVTEHVPELKGVVEYEGITLRMLASQLSGVPKNGPLAGDIYIAAGDFLQQNGFPEPAEDDMSPCDGIGKRPCTRAEVFEQLLAHDLTSQTGQRGEYSNQGFTLLSWALEAITGKTLEQLLEEKITRPLGLSSTGLEAPELSRAVIPTGIGSFLVDFELNTVRSTAGLYSSSKDLNALIRAIFNNELLDATRTRQWFKPAAFAGGFSGGFSLAWEVMRLEGLTPDGRPIDLYTKLGDIPGYATMMFLIPDYEVGGSITVAGDDTYNAVMKLMDIVIEKLVPEIDALARTQAEMFIGHYSGLSHGATTSLPVELVLTLDDGPGVKIHSWTSGGSSVLAVLAGFRGTSAEKLDARLYPTGRGDTWRMVLEVMGTKRGLASRPSEVCDLWFVSDQLRYAGRQMEEFVFEVRAGKVMGVENKGLRAVLEKRLG